MFKRTAIISTGALMLLAVFNMHNIYTYFWTAENATVLLKNCQDNCELTGTLSLIPFNGNYRLVTEGQEIHISKDNIALVTYPSTADLHDKKR